MKVLITGAAGLVASHFARKLARDHEVSALTWADLDISKPETIKLRIAEFDPDLIINGAVVQVDEAEENGSKARAVN
ncbi:MAG: sugar nucleotide-binding protein, partial [Deltaproteobacteria bacterium]|nr:sugar nucleotide-binding protein [Deltaproteobacteria bacterium]